MTPKAVAWGKYIFTNPEVFFLMEEFHNLEMSLPDPARLAHRAVQLHSQISPNGNFGFDVPTFDGIAPHPYGWETSWRAFFTRLLRKSVETDAASNGVWHDLSRAAEHLLQHIVPRLLDPLQEGPDPIKPRLIHGELWGGNIGEDKETGEIMFLDLGSFYGHNELDLGMWRRYGTQFLGQAYLDEYKSIFPPSEPQEGFDDRNRLYSMKFDLNTSAGSSNVSARNT
jgi:protein-ribulosamine 3-kinase